MRAAPGQLHKMAAVELRHRDHKFRFLNLSLQQLAIDCFVKNVFGMGGKGKRNARDAAGQHGDRGGVAGEMSVQMVDRVRFGHAANQRSLQQQNGFGRHLAAADFLEHL